MEKEIVQLNSIADYCKFCGFELLHPLVAVVNMAEASRNYPDGKSLRGELEALLRVCPANVPEAGKM